MAAINGDLAPRLDGIQGQMGMLAGQMTSWKTDVVQLSAQGQHQDQRMTEVERQLKDLRAGQTHNSWKKCRNGRCIQHGLIGSIFRFGANFGTI